MIYSSRFEAFLDACVLYPAPIRDLLLYLAEVELYVPRWTDEVNEEWLRNLLANRKDLKRNRLERTVKAMDTAFPYAKISDYESLIPSIELPDPDDRHVVAAAIKSNCDVIVTFNLKDFPKKYLKQFDLSVQHPDEFICHLIDLSPDKAREAFDNQLDALKNPPMKRGEVLKILKKNGLKITAEKLQ